MSAPAKRRSLQPSERNGNASDDQEDNVEGMVTKIPLFLLY